MERGKEEQTKCKAGVLTGHFGLTQAQDYWKSAVQGESIDDSQGFINKIAMEWETVCEDCALVTYLQFLNDSCSNYTVYETGLWTIKHCNNDMFCCSPDDIVIINGMGMHGISGRGVICIFQAVYPFFLIFNYLSATRQK